MNYLLLITGLSLSAIAAWYAIAGLVAIFAAAVIPIMIMGGALEISKLVLASWIYRNWKEVPVLMKTYFTGALIVLMVLTSMGIFGYLSKAHLDQGVPTGDVAAKVSLIDEKIKIERENIANAQAVIKQMDAAVTGVIATGDQEVKLKDGSTSVRSAAERSLQIRRSQAKDRADLTKQIESSQKKIVALQEEKAPIASELRKVEAEVGPIKYVAALIYGDNPDQNLLERAVRVVIIMIVIVFDPLAVIMLIAANWSLYRSTTHKQVVEEVKDTLIVPEEKEPEVVKEEPLPVKKSKPRKRKWLDPLPETDKTLNLSLQESVIADDSLEFEQRGWPDINKKKKVPKKTEDFLSKAEWIAKSTKVEKEKRKNPRPVYEEFTISSDIEETK